MKIRTILVKNSPFIVAHSLLRLFEASLIVFIALAVPVQPISVRGSTLRSRPGGPSVNTSTGSFTSTVTTATVQVQDLINLVKSFQLSNHLQISLLHDLKDIQDALANGQISTAVSNLNDSITRFNTFVGKGLTSDQANQLVQAADRIKAALGY